MAGVIRWMGGPALAAVLAAASPAAALDGVNGVHVIEVGADEAGAFCADFLLSSRQAALALEQSRRITQEQYLQQFDFLPCYVRGIARLAGDLVRWELRAGGNGTIETPRGRLIPLGCPACVQWFGAGRQPFELPEPLSVPACNPPDCSSGLPGRRSGHESCASG